MRSPLLRRTSSRRARRGAELIEFALVFPMYLFVFFGILEFSWYYYQRGVVIDATRIGCQTAGQLDRDVDNWAPEAVAEITQQLNGRAGIDCGDPQFGCTFEIRDFTGSNPPRVICETRTNFVSLTGFLGGVGDPRGTGGGLMESRYGSSSGRLLPEFIFGRSVSIFEEAN